MVRGRRSSCLIVCACATRYRCSCYATNMEQDNPNDPDNEYSDGDPTTYGESSMKDSLCSDAESDHEANNTPELVDPDDGEQYTYFRCTGGFSEWYSQAIDNEYGDYPYDTPMDDPNYSIGKCTHCHSGEDGDAIPNAKEWCKHFKIREETLFTTMTMDGWACCDCRTTSLSSLWTTQLESPVYCRPTDYNFLWTRRLKSVRSKGYIEYTPVRSNGLLLSMDMGHVPKCPKVNPFNRPNSHTFPTLQSLCVQTIAEARPCSVAVKDLDQVGPGTVIVTNRPLCQCEHQSSSFDCFEWTTSQDFHDDHNTNIHLFYFQPPHPQWINQLSSSLSKRVIRYYVNRHLLLNVSIHVLYVLKFRWEELSPQQLYDDITHEPKSKFLHIYYCQHAHPEYNPQGSDGKLEKCNTKGLVDSS